jgi:hypothetical protein
MAISFHDTTEHEIRLPAAWGTAEAFQLLQCQAGRAYLLAQTGIGSEPEHTIRLSEHSQDYCAYEIFPDGSLWYVNNAEDEVWEDYRDFVQELLNTAAVQGGVDCWEKLNDGDRQLLTHYCDGDEAKAKELVGF